MICFNARWLFIYMYLVYSPQHELGGERALAHPPADAGGYGKRFVGELGAFGRLYPLAFMSPAANCAVRLARYGDSCE